MKGIAIGVALVAFGAFLHWVNAQSWSAVGQARAYRALRDSLATAQVAGPDAAYELPPDSAWFKSVTSDREYAMVGGIIVSRRWPASPGSLVVNMAGYRGIVIPARAATILLYRESDSTLRVARLRAEGR